MNLPVPDADTRHVRRGSAMLLVIMAFSIGVATGYALRPPALPPEPAAAHRHTPTPAAPAATPGYTLDVAWNDLGPRLTAAGGIDIERFAAQYAQAGQPDLDANGAQLGAENVVVIRVAVSDVGVPKTELIGSGEAWVSSGGSTVHGSWSKPNAEAPIRVVGDNGAVIRLAPGNTWVELVPHAGSVALTPAG